MMWDNFNPWREKVMYLTLEEAELLQGRQWVVNAFYEARGAIDFYLLPQPNDRYSMGARYGRAPEEYLSPHVDDELARGVVAARED